MARKVKELKLEGTRVGRLIVQAPAKDRVYKRKGRKDSVRKYWTCLCDCGNTTEVRQDSITGKTTNSCGCIAREAAKVNIKSAQATGNGLKPEDLTGKVFGRLTVREPAERSVTPKGRELPRWWCDCKCGGEINALHDSLKAGKVLTCGCVPRGLADSDYGTKTEAYVHKAREKHGNRYDYSLVKYEHSQEPVAILCTVHGVFLQNASNHLMGHGCPKCSNTYNERNVFLDVDGVIHCKEHGEYKASQGCLGCFQEEAQSRVSDFVEEALKVHGDRYDYSLVAFGVRRDKVNIVCKDHGKFLQSVSSHLSGRGCPECAKESRFLGEAAFIERAKSIHGQRYDYSLVNYEHSLKYVDIVCETHGLFRQKPFTHMRGSGCPKCSREEMATKQHWNYIKRCDLNPELGESDGTLYLVEMMKNDEVFLKVGISTDYTKRVGRYREEGLSIKLIERVDSTCLQVANWERRILRKIKAEGMKYIPKVDFKGWTECATVESKERLTELFMELSN